MFAEFSPQTFDPQRLATHISPLGSFESITSFQENIQLTYIATWTEKVQRANSLDTEFIAISVPQLPFNKNIM